MLSILSYYQCGPNCIWGTETFERARVDAGGSATGLPEWPGREMMTARMQERPAGVMVSRQNLPGTAHNV